MRDWSAICSDYGAGIIDLVDPPPVLPDRPLTKDERKLAWSTEKEWDSLARFRNRLVLIMESGHEEAGAWCGGTALHVL